LDSCFFDIVDSETQTNGCPRNRVNFSFYFFTLVYDPLIKSVAEMADLALPKKN
jgi:hypothetical protein